MSGSLITTISTLPELKASLIARHLDKAQSLLSDLHHCVSKMRLVLHVKIWLSLEWGGTESHF